MHLIVAVALLIGAYLLTSLLAKKPPSQKPATAEDFSFPQVDEGTPQAVVFGDVWTEDWMVLWTGRFRVKTVEIDGGGKK